MAGVAGFEPAALGFGDRCSNQLSYTPARVGSSIRREGNILTDFPCCCELVLNLLSLPMQHEFLTRIALRETRLGSLGHLQSSSPQECNDIPDV